MNESRHTYAWVKQDPSTATWMNESCHTYEWVMSHVWMGYISVFSRMSESGVMSHTWMSHGTHMNESRHTYAWVKQNMSAPTSMNESCRAKWLIHMCNMTHLYVWPYSRVMSHIWMSHVAHVNESCHTHEWVTSHTCQSKAKYVSTDPTE